MGQPYIESLRKTYEKGITIEGANLDPIEVKFGTFDEFFGSYAKSESDKISLEWFKEYFDSVLAAGQFTPVKPMEVEDGHVVIEDGMIFHGCQASLNTLRNISHGLLATEWFGIFESQDECRFCASLNTVRIKQVRLGFGQQGYLAGKRSCMLYFDTSNPLMQKLLQTDFYRYVEMKNKHPEQLEQYYSPEMITFIERWILPFSGCGAHFHTEQCQNLVMYDWWAIPGGIPATLVNGVSISRDTPELVEHIDEIAAMFPNAVIFDENKQILHYPVRVQTKTNNK